MRIANEISLYLKLLHQEDHVPCKGLKQCYRNIIVFIEIYLFFFFFEISKLFAKMPVDGRKLNRGRPLSATKGQRYGVCSIC